MCLAPKLTEPAFRINCIVHVIGPAGRSQRPETNAVPTRVTSNHPEGKPDMELALRDIDIAVVSGSRISKDTLDEIAHLRKTVWKQIAPHGARHTDADWIDPIDAVAIHAHVKIDGKIVASGRVSIHQSMDDFTESSVLEGFPDWTPPLPLGMMGHLVVDPAYRLQGYATLLDLVRIEAARQVGAHASAGLIAPWRVKSLEGLGYKNLGPLSGSHHGYIGKDFFLMQRKLATHISDGYFD